MVSQMAKDCRLPDSALAAHLDGKTCVECGERRGQIRLTIERSRIDLGWWKIGVGRGRKCG